MALTALGTCALFIAGAAFMLRPEPQADGVLLLAQKFSASPDYQVVSHLDELLDSEKNSVWLEN